MKKLVLDLESLAVESFEVDRSQSLRGTVDGAALTDGTYPSDACLATMMLSECLSACRPSGIRNCFSPPPC